MTTKELMLGDYITLADCFNDGKEILIFKVVGLGYDGENSALVLLNGEKACDIVEIDDEWCGIPITPEFLEKNGFEKCIWGGKASWRKYFQINNGVLVCIDWRDGGIMHFGYMGYDSKIPLHYVHKLQHALRLCGIDKEIEL